MSLYREARSGRRRLLVVAGLAVAALAVALLALTHALGGDESEADRLRSLQEDVQPALAALELVPIHYESANPTTHAAAADQLEVARTTIDDVEEALRARDAARTRQLLEDVGDLERLVRTTGRAARVAQATEATAAALRSLVGLPAERR